MPPPRGKLAEILRKHLGPKPRLPKEVVAAIQEIRAAWPEDGGGADSGCSESATIATLRQVLLESTEDGIILVGADGRVLAHNQRFADLWHIPEEVMAKRDFEAILPNVLFNMRHPERIEAYLEEAGKGDAGELREIVEFIDGRYFELSTSPQQLPDGTMARSWAFRNVSQIKRAEEAFRHDAFHDALTGLPNRALFSDRLEQALARSKRSQQRLAVMFMDLDKFKSINDTLGHGAGDELLKVVATRLRSRIRQQDTVSRLAGDEFMLLINALPGVDTALHVADATLDCMRMPFRFEEHTMHVGASLGIALYPEHGQDAESLMKAADVALYQAKEQGRNRYMLFKPGMTNPSTEKMVFENDLRSAVSDERLVVHYQPIVDLGTGAIAAAECLTRWQRRDGQLIPPSLFIPVAESTGLIRPITEFVMRTSVAAAREWHDRDPGGVAISVNFSAQQFWDPQLADQIKAHLDAAELPASRLIIEITESTFMQDPVGGMEALRELRALGVDVAIDDFGTGHSSLSVLRHMPITALKIDKSFVANCEKDSRDGAIAATIIRMAKSLGLRVIAEGVESKSQAVFLKRHGCDAIQGYWFARPMPEARFETLLASRAERDQVKESARTLGTTAEAVGRSP